MSDGNELREKLELPPVSQIGVVVRDMDTAVSYYSSVFGVGPFNVYEFAPDRCWLRGKPCHLRLGIGKAMLGAVELELIEPLEGESLHKEFLETCGEGLQHLGFPVDNYQETLGRFTKAGFEPLMEAATYAEAYGGDLKICYLDTQRVGGVIFEIIWRSWLAEA